MGVLRITHMIIKADELQNNEIEKVIQEIVEKNMQNAKKACEDGDAYCVLSTTSPSGKTLGIQYKDIIMQKLESYGYKRWPHTVYIGGFPQKSVFFTWRKDI